MLLPDQDRRRWDRLLIRRGLAALDRVQALGGDFGPYALQAAIAAAHARAATAEETDWAADRRALPGAGRGLAVPGGRAEPGRRGRPGRRSRGRAGDRRRAARRRRRWPATRYLPAVRADLLARLGRSAEAAAEFARAAELTANERERALFLARAEAAAR